MSQERKGRSSSTSSNISKTTAKANAKNTERVTISQAEFEKQVDNVICPDCKKRCKDNEKAIECEFCERWFHANCQGVNDILYEAIKADGEAGTNFIHWYCNSSCNFIRLRRHYKPAKTYEN